MVRIREKDGMQSYEPLKDNETFIPPLEHPNDGKKYIDLFDPIKRIPSIQEDLSGTYWNKKTGRKVEAKYLTRDGKIIYNTDLTELTSIPYPDNNKPYLWNNDLSEWELDTVTITKQFQQSIINAYNSVSKYLTDDMKPRLNSLELAAIEDYQDQLHSLANTSALNKATFNNPELPIAPNLNFFEIFSRPINSKGV